MNLRQQAEADLKTTLEDDVNGFAFDAIITNPDGIFDTLKVQSGDVHLFLDQDADFSLSVKVAHAAVRISSLTAAGLGIPRAQPKENINPWKFEFNDINDNPHKFTVAEAKPDLTLGIVTVILEVMKV